MAGSKFIGRDITTEDSQGDAAHRFESVEDSAAEFLEEVAGLAASLKLIVPAEVANGNETIAAASWSGEASRKPKVSQIPEDEGGQAAVVNHVVVVGVEITGSQEGGDEIVHIIASVELIGSKVTGFTQIEVRAAIVVLSRGEEAMEQSLLVRAEGGTDLAIRCGRIRPRVSTSRNNLAHVVITKEGANLRKRGRENWSYSGSSENNEGDRRCVHCNGRMGKKVFVKRQELAEACAKNEMFRLSWNQYDSGQGRSYQRYSPTSAREEFEDELELGNPC
jgi:hypothetical protein